MSRYLRLLLLVGTASLVIAAMPHVVFAQEDPAAEPGTETEEDEEDQANKHFAAGRKLYSEGKYKEAIEELLKAYDLRPAPPLLLNIARTYEKLDQKADALKYYKEFLQKARLVDPDRPQVEAVVKKLEREVKVKTGAVTSAQGTETPVAPGVGEEPGALLPSRRQQMIHTPVDSAKVDQPITIMAELPPRVEVDRVTLNVRKGGEIAFHEIPMELQGEAYVARIPAAFVTSTSLQYFIQATKGSGRGSIRAEAGTKTNPNIVVIEGGRSPLPAGYKPVEISSPYRPWVWVGGAVAVACIGGSVAGFLLANDRASAMERWVDEKSCDADCKNGAPPKLTFDVKARDWESEGKNFAMMGQIFLGVGIAATAATGVLLYLDLRHVKRERAKRDRASLPRFVASPWAGQGGAGFVGRVSF